MPLALHHPSAPPRTAPQHENVIGSSSILLRRIAELVQRAPALLNDPERLAVLLEQERRDLATPLQVVEARTLPAQSPTGNSVLVVVVERRRDDVPSEEEIADRFGLTRRESMVAWCLAHRQSNDEIAKTLGVSPHTARHHTERVLAKLGVHSRRAVRTVLLAPAQSAVTDDSAAAD